MMQRKKQYVVGLDYPEDKQHRLKRFVGAMGYDSVRAFIVEAMEEKIKNDLNHISPEDRQAIEHLIGG